MRKRGLPSLGLSLVANLLLCAMVAEAQAHESWLLPTAPVSELGEVTLHLTSGMAFPADDHAIKPERVTRARWRQGEANGALKIEKRGEHALVLGAKLPAATTTTAALELPANALELDAASVEEYLRDLGEPEGVRERWQTQGKWRERYRKSVKAILASSAESTNAGDDPRKSMGLPLELVPVTDPRTLHVGDKFELRLLADGKVLPGIRVGLHAKGVAARFAESDSGGLVTFRLLHPGPTLIYATELRAVEAKDHEWDSDFTTLTLDVPHANH